MAVMSQPPVPQPGPWAPPPPGAGPWAPPAPQGALDHPVFFDDAAAAAAVAAAARNRTWRIASVFISAAISAAIWWFFREELGDLTWTWVAVALVIPLAYLVAAVVREVVVRRDVRRVGQGLALGVGRRGVFLRDRMVLWPEVGAVRARSGRLGASSRLVVETRASESLELPLDYLATRPAGLDSAVFALSGGRVRIDFSALDV